MGFSVGVAIFPAYAGDPDEAVGIADSLMYRVKKSGKNAILFEAFDRTSPGV